MAGHRNKMILDRVADLGIDVNGLVIPQKFIQYALSRYAINLFILNDHEIYKILLAGSATAIRYNGREYLITTQNELKGHEDWSQVAMSAGDGTFITAAGARWYASRQDDDARDLVAFDFTEPCAAHPKLKRHFFDLTRMPPDTKNENIVLFVLAGFPFEGQTYDLHERNHIGVKKLQVVCTLHSQPSDPALFCLQASEPLSLDPNGMSGGSAFVIQMTNERFHGYFAGVIMRGGQSNFYILKAGVVHGFLSSISQIQFR